MAKVFNRKNYPSYAEIRQNVTAHTQDLTANDVFTQDKGAKVVREVMRASYAFIRGEWDDAYYHKHPEVRAQRRKIRKMAEEILDYFFFEELGQRGLSKDEFLRGNPELQQRTFRAFLAKSRQSEFSRQYTDADVMDFVAEQEAVERGDFEALDNVKVGVGSMIYHAHTIYDDLLLTGADESNSEYKRYPHNQPKRGRLRFIKVMAELHEDIFGEDPINGTTPRTGFNTPGGGWVKFCQGFFAAAFPGEGELPPGTISNPKLELVEPWADADRFQKLTPGEQSG